MATAITYTLNYAGDFTTLAAAAAGIGTDLTYTQAANTAAGSTGTTIVLTGATAACVGHTVTSGGETHLIGAFNAGTQVATLTAKAGYTGTWAVTPGAAVAYTIADVDVTLSLGQSSPGSTVWALGAASWVFGAIATSATCRITVVDPIGWNANLPLRANTGGNPAQAVCITSSNYPGVLDITPDYFTIRNIGLVSTSINCIGVYYRGAQTVNLTNVVIDVSSGVNGGVSAALHVSASGTYLTKSVVAYGNAYAYFNSANNSFHNNLTSYGFGHFNGSFTGTFTDCAIMGTAAGNIFPYSYTAVVRCASDQNVASMTVVTLNGQFVSTTPGAYDFRPISTSQLLGIGGVPASTPDIFGTARNGSASTIGAAETALTLPATQALNYSVVYTGGDIPIAAPSGLCTGTWAAGVGTITTAAPHTLPVGMTVPVSIGDWTARTAWEAPIPGGYYATVTGASTFTVSIASDPGAAPANFAWVGYIFQAWMGGASADLTYFSLSKTCSGIGSSTTIVLDASETAACVGHPIKWKTDPLAMIMAFNASTHTATIKAIVGLAGTFTGTPQVGDSYTVYPITTTFSLGESALGINQWASDVYSAWIKTTGTSYGAAINMGPAISDVNHWAKVRGVKPFNPAVPLGSSFTTGSAITIKNGDGTTGHPNHVAVLGIGMGDLYIEDLQFYCTNQIEENGCFIALNNVTSPVYFNRVLAYSQNGVYNGTHDPIFCRSPFTIINVIATNLVGIGTSYQTYAQASSTLFTMDHCMFLVTCNGITTSVGSTASGSGTITVASVAGINAAGPNVPGTMLGGVAGITIGTYVVSIAGNVLTLSANTTAIIAASTPIYFGTECFGTDTRGSTFTNTGFFGTMAPSQNLFGAGGPYSHCATELNPFADAGFTTMAYAGLFTAASGVATGAVDARPATSALNIGIATPTITDIYGHPFTNLTVGAVAFPVTGVGGGTFRVSALSGNGSGGPFFSDALGSP